jgi:peptidoglycan biosynthesis protein MviN/MurJ (putative lipid II flippase)
MTRKIFVYNFLNALQIFLGFIFQILLARRFGASSFSDVFFSSVVIVGTLSTIGHFFTEIFVQYYNDLRVKGCEEAKRFYQTVYNFSLLIGVITFILTIFFVDPIMNIFVSGFNVERLKILKSFIMILAWSLIWSRLITLNNSLINAEMRFMVPYLVSLTTPTFNIISLLAFTKVFGINAIAISMLASDILTLFIQQSYIAKSLHMPLGKTFWHSDLKKLIRTSFSMRLGNQIWDLKEPITTNILSRYPVGTVSLYYYSVKIISVLYTITNSPILRIYSAKVSRLVSQKGFLEIKRLLKQAVLLNGFLLLVVLLPFAFGLSKILIVVFGNKFSPEDVKIIHHIFLFLIPFYLILTLEVPFTSITVALKQSAVVLKTGVFFILIYCAAGFSLLSLFGVYAIPIALMMAQLQNLFVYSSNVQKIFEQNL